MVAIRLTLALVVAAFGLDVLAGDAPNLEIPTAIEVTCENALLKAELSSFVGREIRRLPDVKLLVEEPAKGGLLKLHVVATDGCNESCVAIAWAISDRYFVSSDSFLTVLVDQGVILGSRKDVKGLASTLGVAFDNGGVDYWRKMSEREQKLLEEIQKKAKQ
jgi:hypothetical protein